MENINFKKKFGQNFISDTNLLKAIVSDSEITENSDVLEIGAGAGTLTLEIAKKCNKLISYEIDNSLKDIIENRIKNQNNVEIIFQDILKVNTKEIDDKFKNKYKIIANLPYYITSPIIFKFLEQSKKLESMTIMVQKEVAEKMLAKPKTSNYGVLSIMVNHYADVKITRVVKKQMFTPMPKVDSCVVVLKIKHNNYDEKFKTFIQTSFSMRRKTLFNNLLKLYNKEEILDVFKTLNYSVTIRAEELTLENFYNLYNCFRQN